MTFKKIKKTILLLILVFFLESCMTGVKQDPVVPKIIYTGAKVSIAVARITNRTGVHGQVEGTGTTIQTGSAAAPPDKKITYRDPIGTGMRDQLITALVQTGVFNVARGNGRAEYFMEGAITEYEPSQASIAGGYGWGLNPRRTRISDPTVSPGNIFSQILAPNALAGLLKQDHIAMSIHLVNRRTNSFVASTTIEASPRDLGIATNLLFGGLTSMADGGAQVKTPMQKAIRACMTKAAKWSVNVISNLQNRQPMRYQSSSSRRGQPSIRKVQYMLSKAGYNPGQADGKMGSKTRTAIKNFQRKNGLSVNGQISQQLFNRLNTVVNGS